MMLSEPQIEVAVRFWTERLPATPKVDVFAEALRRLLRGTLDTPFGRLVRDYMRDGRALALYTWEYPQGPLAEACLVAGLTREFVMFPKHRCIILSDDGAVTEGVPRIPETGR